jgi:hypothetical protein
LRHFTRRSFDLLIFLLIGQNDFRISQQHSLTGQAHTGTLFKVVRFGYRTAQLHGTFTAAAAAAARMRCIDIFTVQNRMQHGRSFKMNRPALSVLPNY